MRLLHVIHSLNPDTGGPAEAAKTFALHSSDSHQSILTLDHSTDPWITPALPVHCIGPGRGRYGYTPQAARWFQNNIAYYDAAIIHGCWQYHGLAASRAARREGIPYFVFPHGMLDRYFEESSRLKHLKKLLYWPVEKSILRGAKAVFYTAEEERERASNQFRVKAPARVVPLGTDIAKYPPAESREAFLERFPHLRGKRTLLFLGRLHAKKGVDLLIRAFGAAQEAADCHLVIAGPAASAEVDAHLHKLAAESGAGERITFTGMLTGVLKFGAFASAEAFILPSHQENFGIAVIESLASGVPVLLSRQVNIWREICDDEAGLAGLDTPEGVRELLAAWFRLSENERERMRGAASACYHSRFRADAASERLLRTLRECGLTSNERASIRFESVHA
jgi:glycosyltransferase involved in cell wall biosynthesis